MGFMFCDLHVSLNNPSSGDINLSNLPCLFFFCYIVLSVSCSLVNTCWERADFLALLYVTVSCVFVTFPKGILGQVWYLIVLIPDLCLLAYCVLGYKRKYVHKVLVTA